MKPYEALTELDHERIENFIGLYGILKSEYIGNEEYLFAWNKNKENLFKMLGGKLIYKLPFEFNKTKNQLRDEMSKVRTDREIQEMVSEMSAALSSGSVYLRILFSAPVLVANEVEEDLFFFIKDKKPFKIQKGSRPLKMIGKLLDYCGLGEKYKDLYEKFRIDHSMVLGNKVIKGTLCLSIHPLDFMTMSDNANDWSTCMSWENEGCYRAGTVEMMNSEQAIVVYIESEKKYYFNDIKDEEHSWNSKRYRQLFYVDKDILLSGKSYPYASSPISLSVLDILKELIEKNLGWKYSSEVAERYVYPNRDKSERCSYDPPSAMIKVDTNIMYNDMFNDKERKYYCFVSAAAASWNEPHSINVSGPTICLSCGESLLYKAYDSFEQFDREEDDDYFDDAEDKYRHWYNHRYEDTENVVCWGCLEKVRCYDCGMRFRDESKLIEFNGRYYCLDCARNNGII